MAQPGWPAVLTANQGLHSDWLQAACVAADAMHLLNGALTANRCQPSSTKRGLSGIRSVRHQLTSLQEFF
jgi:hypothetical protein